MCTDRTVEQAGHALVLYGLRDLFVGRFMSKVEVTDDCWVWTSRLRYDGYGQFQVFKGVTRRAHRVAYELFVGPVPEGLVLDHLCRNRACVNPGHLEPVSIAENTLRGVVARRTGACVNGHAWTPETAYEKGKHRSCRVCHRERERVRRARDPA
jgi:hypothetical protein